MSSRETNAQENTSTLILHCNTKIQCNWQQTEVTPSGAKGNLPLFFKDLANCFLTPCFLTLWVMTTRSC